MAKYQVIATTVFEMESNSPPYDTVLAEARSVFDRAFTRLPDGPEMRTSIKIDHKKTVLRNIIIGVFSPEDVFPYITKENVRRTYNVDGKDYEVRMNSQRYFVFNTSHKCVCCGIEGTKMILEQHPAHLSPHFNLYAEAEGGKLVLMTKDHIQAKANGGSDIYSNFQTMCSVCNNLKGAANLTIEGLKELRQIYDDNKVSCSRKRLAVVLHDARERLTLPVVVMGEVYISGLRSGPDAETAVAAVDLYLWQQPDGKLIGKSVYEINEDEHSSLVGCIKKGLVQEVQELNQGMVAIRMADGRILYVYEGHLKLTKAKEKCA